MKGNKEMNTILLAFTIILMFSLIMGVFVFGSYLIRTGAFGTLATTTSSTALNAPSAINTILSILLGSTTEWTWETLITRGVIFILLFALISQLLETLTTYRKNTTTFFAFVISALLGFSGVITLITTGTKFIAVLGGMGIAILLTCIFISAVLVHFGLGSIVRKLKAKLHIHRRRRKSEKRWKKRGETLKRLDEIDEETRLIRDYGL